MALADALSGMVASQPMQAPQPVQVPMMAPAADPGDLSNQFNTQLAPEDEAKFQTWQQANPHIGSTYDYDARGFWKAGAQQGANGHGDDKFKKPNHPTFSTGSQYSTPDNPGGTWAQDKSGSWAFYASPANLKYQDEGDLQHYWQKVEAAHGNRLILPIPMPGAR